MTDRIVKELNLLKTFFQWVEWHESAPLGWIKIPKFPIPPGLWNQENTIVTLEIPQGFPGAAPYGFYVKGGLRLLDGNKTPQNYSEPAHTPFDGLWGKFSWAAENWRPTEDLVSGSNLSNFVLSFKDRLNEGT